MQNLLLDSSSWQRLVDNHYQAFAAIKVGGRIGLMPKSEFARQDSQILVWEILEGRVGVTYQPFKGFREAEVDVLFVAENDAFVALYNEIKNEALTEFKKLLRAGQIIFYVMRQRRELLDLGYEELIDLLGLPFLGGCH